MWSMASSGLRGHSEGGTALGVSGRWKLNLSDKEEAPLEFGGRTLQTKILQLE
jgi:hypothetical protein